MRRCHERVARAGELIAQKIQYPVSDCLHSDLKCCQLDIDFMSHPADIQKQLDEIDAAIEDLRRQKADIMKVSHDHHHI